MIVAVVCALTAAVGLIVSNTIEEKIRDIIEVRGHDITEAKIRGIIEVKGLDITEAKIRGVIEVKGLDIIKVRGLGIIEVKDPLIIEVNLRAVIIEMKDVIKMEKARDTVGAKFRDNTKEMKGCIFLNKDIDSQFTRLALLSLRDQSRNLPVYSN